MSALPLHRAPTDDYEWLPERCPTWCRGEHAVALSEMGTDPESWRSAQEHFGTAYDEMLVDIHNCAGKRLVRPGGASYDVSQRRRPTRPDGTYSDAAVVRLQVSENYDPGVALNLLPSEARTLARRLLHLADGIELAQ